MLKMQQIHNRVHTFHISLAVTHRERNLVVEIDKKSSHNGEILYDIMMISDSGLLFWATL